MKKALKEQITNDVLFTPFCDAVKNIGLTKTIAEKSIRKIIFDYSDNSLSIKFTDGESLCVSIADTPVTPNTNV